MLCFPHGIVKFGGDARSAVAEVKQMFWKVFKKNLSSRTEYDRVLDRIFQFSNVAGPVIAKETVGTLLGEASYEALVLPAIDLCEMPGQRWNIFAASLPIRLLRAAGRCGGDRYNGMHGVRKPARS